jgi:putative ABC transport system permease protein
VRHPGPRTHHADAGDLQACRLSSRDVLDLGLTGIRSRPVRAVLSTLGISVGIATVLLILGISASSQAGLAARLDSLGANLLQAQAQAQDDLHIEFPAGADAMVRRIGPVTDVAQLAVVQGVVGRTDRVNPDDQVGLTAFATSPALLPVLHATMNTGRFLDARTASMRTVVLGWSAASNLGINATVTGREAISISIGGDHFTVIGILDKMLVTSDLDYGVFVGWDSAVAALGFTGHATTMYVRTEQDQLDAVRTVLGPTLYPGSPGFVNVSQPSTARDSKRAVDTSAAGLSLALAAVSLLVGAIGIANTMYVSVLERRREIGQRRALGATRGHIRIQFLAEATILATAGAGTGIAIGAVGTAGYALHNALPVVISLATAAGALIGGLAVGILAGLYPAFRAARLTPVEALATT